MHFKSQKLIAGKGNAIMSVCVTVRGLSIWLENFWEQITAKMVELSCIHALLSALKFILC